MHCNFNLISDCYCHASPLAALQDKSPLASAAFPRARLRLFYILFIRRPLKILSGVSSRLISCADATPIVRRNKRMPSATSFLIKRKFNQKRRENNARDAARLPRSRSDADNRSEQSPDGNEATVEAFCDSHPKPFCYRKQ